MVGGQVVAHQLNPDRRPAQDEPGIAEALPQRLGQGAAEVARLPPVRGTADKRRNYIRSSLAMTNRWISLVPSPIVVSFTSRKYFSAG